MREKINQTIKYFLPILFTVYAGLVIAYTHVHIINGVIIVHSHVQADNQTDKGEDHPHTNSELVLYNQLSCILTHSFEIPFVQIEEPLQTIKIIPFFCSNTVSIVSKFISSNLLRAPPTL